ncbi:MAG: flagella basal body P-ring formation protein FlgA [Parasphingorhabdus sp.]
MSKVRFAIPILSLLCMGAASSFEDTAHLDRQVGAYLNANIGEGGGARAPIDEKLKLKRCLTSVQFSPTNRNSVMVSCPSSGWRIFVPLNANQSSRNRFSSNTEEFVVRRNQPLTLVVKRPSFSISYSVIAQKNGRIGDYIPVRSSRKSKTLMARVSGNGQVELAQ